MNYLFSIIVFVHGSIHLWGAIKHIQYSQIPNTGSGVSKVSALFWIISFLLFAMSAILYLLEIDIWLLFSIFAVIISSFLIIGSWGDAKYGMIPNVIILFVVALYLSSLGMEKMIAAETQEILNGSMEADSAIITESDVKELPSSVYKWMHNSGMVGRQRINSAYVKQKLLMKMKPEQTEWKSAEAQQYTALDVPAFIWTVDMNLASMIKLTGRDKFMEGKGEMLIKINYLINAVKEKGERIDEGSIQRFLGELVWYPSLALSPNITWEQIDEFSAEATMTYRGTTGSGTFYFDENGDFIRFVALRYMGNRKDAKRYPWVLTVDDYAVFDGIKVPSKMKATWKLDEGEWTWLNMEIVTVKYNNISLN